MYLNIALIRNNKENHYQFESTLEEEKYKKIHPLKAVKSFKCDLDVSLYEDYLSIKVKGKALVTLISSYTLKEFDKEIKVDDLLEFSLDEDNLDFDVITENVFEIDDYLFAILSSSIPMVVFQKGEELPESGKNYRVISEKDLEKENLDPRLSILDDVKLDD